MKKYFKKILGITKLEKELSSSKKFIEILINNEKFYLEEIKKLNKFIGVGVDLHVHNPNENWAVVCIKGKPDYVKFISLGSSDIVGIRKFLSQFDSKNIIFDAPCGINKKRFLRP